MNTHFIFHPGKWIGEGVITFNATTDRMKFKTEWKVEPKSDSGIMATQKVEIEGYDEPVENHYFFSEFKNNTFELELNSEYIGESSGNGVLDDVTLGWEFREHPNFEGFEAYTLKANGEYSFHAEFSSPDKFSTIIDGKLHKQ